MQIRSGPWLRAVLTVGVLLFTGATTARAGQAPETSDGLVDFRASYHFRMPGGGDATATEPRADSQFVGEASGPGRSAGPSQPREVRINDYLDPVGRKGSVVNGPCQQGSIYTLEATWRNKTADYVLFNIQVVKSKLVHLDETLPTLLSTYSDASSVGLAPGQTFGAIFRIQLVSCTPFQFFVNVYGDLTGMRIKLIKVGDTVISKDGKFSEDTTVEAYPVRGDTGEQVFWKGTINVKEQCSPPATPCICTQNGGSLPGTVVMNPWGSFVAKSLAGPVCTPSPCDGTNGSPPRAAKILTTPFPLYAPFEIAQWVNNGKLHDKSDGDVFDWVEERAKYIYGKADAQPAPKEVKTVLDAIASYTVGAGPWAAVTTTARTMTINPYFETMRVDSASVSVCGQARAYAFTNTLAHEARHAYQTLLQTTAVAGVTDDIAGQPDNDDDSDRLLERIPIAPTNVAVDSGALRDVCNVNANTVQRRRYRGDATADPWEVDPGADQWGCVSWAREMDAYTFAGNREAGLK